MPDEITADDWDAALKEAQEEIEKEMSTDDYEHKLLFGCSREEFEEQQKDTREMTDELLLGCTGDEIHGEQSLKAKES